MKKMYVFTLIVLGMIMTAYPQVPDKTIVLVHAQWHDEWCWNKLLPLLDEKNLKAVAFDLPGHGKDTVSVEDVTFEACVQKVVSVANDQAGQVIFVGHSSSGILISQAAEILGKDKVASLVFLDAFMPNDGESVFSLAEKFAPAGTPLGQSLILSKDQKTISLNLKSANELLYHDCPVSDQNFALSNLREGPFTVLATTARLTDSRYGAIPKFYILCTLAKDMDKTKLATNVPCRKIYSLTSSHSLFFPYHTGWQKFLRIFIDRKDSLCGS